MKETHCPLCHGELETRDVAPCDDCGWDPVELDHFRAGKHQYAEFEIIDGHRLVLCDFCAVDFGSYPPGDFGLSPSRRIGFETMSLVRIVRDPVIGRDKFCPACGHRLAFLRFVAEVRKSES